MKLFSRRPQAPSNPALLQAMEAVARHDNAQTRQGIYRALLAATFVLPQPGSAPRGVVGRRYEAGEEIALQTSQLEDGRVLLAVFTDLDRLRKVFPETQAYLAIRAVDLFRLAADHHFASLQINPNVGPGGFVTASEIEQLAQGRIPTPGPATTTLQEPTQVLIGVPAPPLPDAFFQAVKAGLAQYPEVAEAYVFMMALPGEKPELVLGMRYNTPLNRQAEVDLRQRLFQSLAPYLDNRTLAYLTLNDDLLNSLREQMPPVFKRA